MPSASSLSSAHRRGPVQVRYDALVANGAIERDDAQELLVERLDELAAELAVPKPVGRPGVLGRLFGAASKFGSASKSASGPGARGLYVWGSVGRGKTMLMDLFYDEVTVATKRRAHFNAFMADAHERIFQFRQAVKRGERKDTDPMPFVAAELAAEATVLCFDEFTVTDIADAMILGRLFKVLFEKGVTVVATSNVEPDKLYENGLNRALFLPFTALIETHMEVFRLDSRTDFRLEKLGGSPVYHVPAGPAAHAALGRMFQRLSGLTRGRPRTLIVKGHAVDVPEAGSGVARFSFPDICGKPYGASDYMAVAQNFHTVILEDIPILDIDRRNEAKRLITLIDVLYDSHVKLLASAAAEPPELYVGTSGREAFEFERTTSRLIEMRSDAYLGTPHGRAREAGDGATGVVET
nr:cell division protein ZapE [Chelatococcus reniformis]